MKKYCITFAGGDANYYDAGNRLVEQVNNLELFHNVQLFTDKDLKTDEEFWGKHSSFIENNKRGYGYWIWKPYIIKKMLEQMENGDILLYMDCGCEVNIKKKGDFISLFQGIQNGEVLDENTCIIDSYTGWPEYNWNKMDLILLLDMNDEKYLLPNQNQASTLLLYVCNNSRQLVNEWYDIACDYHNIDDNPSIARNIDGFIEHRHDQSIYSLLVKKKNLFCKTKSMYDYVDIARNKTGNTVIESFQNNGSYVIYIIGCVFLLLLVVYLLNIKETNFARIIRANIYIVILFCVLLLLYNINNFINIEGMQLLTNETDYDNTIQLALNMNEEYNKEVIFHCYWNGVLNEKHVYSVLSCYYFNVYNNKHKLIVWLENNTPNEYNIEIEKYAEIRYFSMENEKYNTGFLKNNDFYYNKSKGLSYYADIVRCLLLYNYGGVWFDLDIFFLRSFDPLFYNYENEICVYNWENQQYPNNAIFISLKPYSVKMKKNIEFIIQRNQGWGFQEANLTFDLPLDILVLPCSWFDPDWIYNSYDTKGVSTFFENTDREYTFDTFFKGSFCYHWHNQWNKEIGENSPCSQLVRIINNTI